MTHTNIDGVLFNTPAPSALHQRVAADILALADEPPRVRPSDVMLSRTDALQQAYRTALLLAVVMRRQVEGLACHTPAADPEDQHVADFSRNPLHDRPHRRTPPRARTLS